jgi:hypothetical protein
MYDCECGCGGVSAKVWVQVRMSECIPKLCCTSKDESINCTSRRLKTQVSAHKLTCTPFNFEMAAMHAALGAESMPVAMMASCNDKSAVASDWHAFTIAHIQLH